MCGRQALGAIESAIRLELTEVGICTPEELTERLPYYSRNQAFAAVGRLSREGTVTNIGALTVKVAALQGDARSATVLAHLNDSAHPFEQVEGKGSSFQFRHNLTRDQFRQHDARVIASAELGGDC